MHHSIGFVFYITDVQFVHTSTNSGVKLSIGYNPVAQSLGWLASVGFVHTHSIGFVHTHTEFMFCSSKDWLFTDFRIEGHFVLKI